MTSFSLILCLSLTGEGGRPIDAAVDRLSNEAQRLLRIAEDTERTYRDRTDAIEQLGKRRERACVPRLLRMLPGQGDVATRSVVVALKEIGDPQALPKLRKLRDDPPFKLHGKINATIDWAIKELERR